MAIPIPGVTDQVTNEVVWEHVRDVGAIITSVGVPFALWVINQFHRANVKRFEHLDECIDKLKTVQLDEARSLATTDEVNTMLTRMQSALQERMAVNMDAATRLMAQRETTLASSFDDIRERLRALENAAMRDRAR